MVIERSVTTTRSSTASGVGRRDARARARGRGTRCGRRRAPAPARRRPARRRRRRPRRASAVAGVGERGAAGRDRGAACRRCAASSSAAIAGVGRLGVGVHPGDRRARDDVVELLGQHLAPEVVERRADRAPTGGRRPQLGLAQQPLAAAVAELRAQLAGERAAVGLEVQLAAPHRHRRAAGDLGLDVVEELGRRARARRCGMPSRSASRRSRSSISRVGPPPPSP